MQAQMLQTMQ
jgi:hypothetical protein